jgi:uncharacterized protein (TIGR00369 family)
MTDSSSWPPLPPSTGRLGAERTRWADGRSAIRWRVPVEDRFCNAGGMLHGGYLCVLADAALGSSLASLVGESVAIVNPDLSAHFLAPVRPGTTLLAEGRVVRQGRTVSFLEAAIRDESGETVLVAQSTAVVRERRTTTSGNARPAEETAMTEDLEALAPPPVGAPSIPYLPPWFADLGARLRALGDGEVELVWPIRDRRFENRHGVVQGGYVALVADSAMGFALIAGVSGVCAMATTTLAMQLMLPVRTGQLVRVHARVERRGRRFGFMRCEVSAGGTLVASGRASGLLERS